MDAVPALPSVESVLRARFHWSDSSDNNVWSTMFFQYSGSAPSAATCTTLATDMCTAWHYAAENWTDSTQLTGCQLTDLTSPTSGQGEVTVSLPGTLGGDDLAGGTCVVISYGISRRYRGGKPRNYFPFFSGTELNGRQAWQPSSIGRLNTDFAEVISGIIGTEVGGTTISNHVNVSYYSGFTVFNPGGGKRAKNVPTLRAVPLVDTITGYTILNRPASQRRRNA